MLPDRQLPHHLHQHQHQRQRQHRLLPQRQLPSRHPHLRLRPRQAAASPSSSFRTAQHSTRSTQVESPGQASLATWSQDSSDPLARCRSLMMRCTKRTFAGTGTRTESLAKADDSTPTFGVGRTKGETAGGARPKDGCRSLCACVGSPHHNYFQLCSPWKH